MALRKVEIVVTKTVVGSYEARSYPDSQIDAMGFFNLYRVPVYNIVVKGTDKDTKSKAVTFIAPRFMPYFNNPKKPSPITRNWDG